MSVFKCKYCIKEFSLRVIVRHIRDFHKENYDEFVQNYKNAPKTTCPCGSLIDLYRNINSYILQDLYDVKPKLNKFCNIECRKKFPIIWNKGLSKETSEIIYNQSQKMKVENNPIHNIINDPQKKKLWLEKMLTKETLLKRKNRLLGKTWEELYGDEKSAKFKKYHSDRLKKEKIHFGFKHSKENKKLFAINAAKMHQENKFNKISKEEDLFYLFLLKNFNNFSWQRNKNYKYYTLDFSIPELNFGIELDGDYWHCNRDLGYFPKSLKQKRNIINDKRKNTYFSNRNILVIRIWVSDFKNDESSVLELIKRNLCNIQKLNQSNL